MTTTKPPVLSIPRSLLGKIVDEVFDGACEDTSAIEDIYRVIISEQAVLERAGADAVRDAALEEAVCAVRLIEIDPTTPATQVAKLAVDAIRALKGTLAAAVEKGKP